MPKGNGPLPEFQLWTDKEAALGSIVEQLRKPKLTKIIHILELAKSPAANQYVFYLYDLKKALSEARDNVKFLTTIKRYLNVIKYNFL